MFLGSGSVIHAMHHEQDMTKMGGLKNIYLLLIGLLWLAG
jgi:NADH-quinone oxidoreductase subunit L